MSSEEIEKYMAGYLFLLFYSHYLYPFKRFYGGNWCNAYFIGFILRNSMRQCSNCNTAFKYRDKLKSIWYNALRCRNYGFSYKVTLDSKILLFFIIIITTAFIMASMDVHFFLAALLGLMTAIFTSLFSPIVVNTRKIRTDALVEEKIF